MAKDYIFISRRNFEIQFFQWDGPHDLNVFHAHNGFEIYYQLEGTRHFFFEKESFVVNAGDMILVNKNTLHKTGSVGEGECGYFVLNFSGEYIKSVNAACSGLDVLGIFSDPHCRRVSGLNQRVNNNILELLRGLYFYRESHDASTEAVRKLALCIIMVQLRSFFVELSQREGVVANNPNHLAEEIQTYVSEHYTEPLSLSQIAEHFYISPYYLSRMFKKNVNVSLIEYINSVRIKAAQSVIEKTDDSISAVANTCGFQTTAHFRRVFKEYTGLSPQQYRQFFKKNHEENIG